MLNLKGRDILVELGIGGTVTLKYILEKYMWLQAVLNWLRVVYHERFL
jgi:hypothetical protein